MRHSAWLLVSVSCFCGWCPTHCDASQDATSDKRVAVLIDRMIKADTEEKAFSQLEALGCAAVPATIRRMDDRRSLPDPRISLRNKSPQAFEGIRHYGPQQVVDALAAILNQVTGQDFGFIYNGATDEERTKTIRGWRQFLESTPAPELCKPVKTGSLMRSCAMRRDFGPITAYTEVIHFAGKQGFSDMC